MKRDEYSSDKNYGIRWGGAVGIVPFLFQGNDVWNA